MIESVSLLPLVDILFATAGIFLILITVLSAIKTMLPTVPEQPDLVIACTPGGEYIMITQNNSVGEVVSEDDLEKNIRSKLSSTTVTKVLCAFSKDAFNEQATLKRILESLRQRIFQSGGRGSGMNIDSVWWPLADGKSEEIPIVTHWREADAGVR